MREVRILVRRGRPGVWTALIVGLAFPAGLHAQAGHDMHGGHAMHGAAMEGGWVMPPMDPTMPMLPGLETAVPPVSAWLPGEGHDPSHFPEALPSAPVDVPDGGLLELEVTTVRKRIAGREYLMYGYNGQIPGPLIRAPRGGTIQVRVTNRIPMETTVHWHGIRLDQEHDGVPGMPHPPIAPGESFTYEIRVPDAGVFWYHPHVREDIQQDLGLHANLVVRDPDAPPPPVNREEVLVLDDLLLADNGRLIPWGQEAPTYAVMGRFGTWMLVQWLATYHRIRCAGRGGALLPGECGQAPGPSNVRFRGAAVKLVAADQGAHGEAVMVPSVGQSPRGRLCGGLSTSWMRGRWRSPRTPPGHRTTFGGSSSGGGPLATVAWRRGGSVLGKRAG